MIEVKIDGLDEEIRKLQRLGSTFDKHVTEELNDHGMEWRDDVRANTSVVTGDLRRSVTFEGVEKHGDEFVSTVSSNMEYAEHYEYGHRQDVGRYVPALGKCLVQRYVKGRHTFRLGRMRAQKNVDAALKRAVAKAEGELSRE